MENRLGMQRSCSRPFRYIHEQLLKGPNGMVRMNKFLVRKLFKPKFKPQKQNIKFKLEYSALYNIQSLLDN